MGAHYPSFLSWKEILDSNCLREITKRKRERERKRGREDERKREEREGKGGGKGREGKEREIHIIDFEFLRSYLEFTNDSRDCRHNFDHMQFSNYVLA